MPFLASKGCFWPPTASMTSETKITYAYVITQGICNNFIEAIFFVGCMVWQPNRLLQHSTTMSLINKMEYRLRVPALRALWDLIKKDQPLMHKLAKKVSYPYEVNGKLVT
jgi:hypothetical protein